MAYCTHCGKEVADDAPACPNCGHPRGRPASGRRTEGLAVASFILGIAGFVICPLIPHIVAVILGNQAREKIRLDPALEGDGLAKAGVIMGWVGIGLSVLAIVAVIIAFVLFAGSSSSDFDFGSAVMLR